jgi:hypothetical protein
MKICTGILLQALALLLLSGGDALSDDTGGAVRNPFTRPVHVSDSNLTQSSATDAEMFELRATLAAGINSLANINGEIVALGDVFNGYRLIEVGEGSAVFARNGVRYPLSISKNGAEPK